MSLVANLPEKLQIFPEKLQIFPEKLQIFPEKLQIFPDPALWQKGLRFPQVGSRSSQDLQEKRNSQRKARRRTKKRLLCVNLTYKTGTVFLSLWKDQIQGLGKDFTRRSDLHSVLSAKNKTKKSPFRNSPRFHFSEYPLTSTLPSYLKRNVTHFC